MSGMLTVELPDEVFAALAAQSRATGRPGEELAAARLKVRLFGRVRPDNRSEEEKQKARRAFRSMFGTINMPEAVGLDNERIDQELANEYLDDHEGK